MQLWITSSSITSSNLSFNHPEGKDMLRLLCFKNCAQTLFFLLRRRLCLTGFPPRLQVLNVPMFWNEPDASRRMWSNPREDPVNRCGDCSLWKSGWSETDYYNRLWDTNVCLFHILLKNFEGELRFWILFWYFPPTPDSGHSTAERFSASAHLI